MLNEEIIDGDEFLKFKASELELVFAEKIVLALMGLYVIWTISLYRIFKIGGEQELSGIINKYKGYAIKIEKNAHDYTHKTINGAINGI